MINIVDFYVRSDHSHVVEPVVLSYASAPTELATGKFKMYHIQLPAFRKTHRTPESVKGDTFLTWLYLLDRGYQDEEELKMLTETTEGLRNFAARYHYAINDPDLIRHYRMIEDGKRDIATKISVAEKRARAEERLAVARNFKRDGLDPELIARNTGLSIQEIEAL